MRRAFLLACVAAAGGCGTPESTVETEVPEVRRWLAGEAANAVDENGRIILSQPNDYAGRALATAEQAIAHTTANVRIYRGYSETPEGFHGERLSHIEKEHGDLVEFGALRPGRRVYLTQTPYEPISDMVAQYIRENRSPHFIVTYHARDGRQVLVTGVLAEDTSVGVRPDGTPLYGPGGSSFTQHTVTAAAEYPVPLTPECAVRLLAEITGRKVVKVPELLHPGGRIAPTIVYWKLELDQPVTVRGYESQGVDTTRVIYLNVEPQRGVLPAPLELVWRRALPAQPEADTIQVPSSGSLGIPQRFGDPPPRLELVPLELRIRPGHAVNFERILPVNGSGQPRVRHMPCSAPVEE